MTRIVIAGNDHPSTIAVPDRLSPGDTIRITGTLRVYGVAQDTLDVTPSWSATPEHLPGELQLETVALDLRIEPA